jgi:tetratricopeptide (TPR) repeat protein
MDTLSSLVDSSLVRPEPTDDEPRFRLLDTIRQYALERLREGDEWTRVHDRHAAYFLALAEPTATELAGPGQLAWLNRLEIRHDNLAAALSWLVDTGQTESAVQMIGATWRFWRLHDHAEELARHASRLLATTDRMTPRQQALALSGAGFTFMAGGDYGRARSMFESSLPRYRRAEDKLGTALTTAALGHVMALQHEDARATTLLEQTLAGLQGTGADQLAAPERLQYLLAVALAANFLGQTQLSHGDHDRAARMFTDGLNAARRAQEHFTILVSLYDLALSSHQRRDLSRGARLLEEGIAVAVKAGDWSAAAYYLEALGAVASDQGYPERAVGLLSAAAALLQASGSGWLHAYVPRAPHGDDVLAALRTRVGHAAFEQARARGRALDGRRILQHVMEQAHRAAVPA